MCYCAAVARVGNEVFAFTTPVSVETFSKNPDEFMEDPAVFNVSPAFIKSPVTYLTDRKLMGYITHMVFGRTEEDVKTKLENLKWHDYASGFSATYNPRVNIQRARHRIPIHR